MTKAQPRPAGASASSSPATWFPAPVIFGHFLLAAAGLVGWIAYLIAGKTPLAWAAFIILLPVALLGFTMFARWIGVYRGGGYVEPHQVGGAAAQPGQSGHRRSERVNDGAARCVMGSVVCTPAAVR